MTNEEKVTKWLRGNTDLSWSRTSGDSPAVKLDRLYINRSEAYEIRDLIVRYYSECNLLHKSENYQKSLSKIINYRKGEKVKTDDLLDYLKSTR